MTAAVAKILAEAMKLTDEERASVAYLLLARELEPPADWWERVSPELERRLAAADSGETPTRSWEDVRARMYERLDALQH
jgi:hypothetical protein